MPGTNAEESRVRLDRARIQADMAELAAGRQYWHEACHHLVRAAELAIKATYIAHGTPVPRKHQLQDLLVSCPVSAVREQVGNAFDRPSLERFSRYYLSVYPDGEDADQGSYWWCSQVTRVVMRCTEDNLP